jgi:hypothetical protein
MPRHITPPTPEEDAAITAAANSDPDARPFSDSEWEQVKPLVRRGRSLGNSMTTHRPTDEATVDILKADPAFAATYLTVALDEADKPGGKAALLAALRNVATAHDLDLTPDPSGPEPDEKPAA